MSAVLEVGKMNGTLKNGVPAEVEWLMQCWARGARKMAKELNWPASTVLARIIEYGPLGASNSGKPPTALSSDEEEIDKILSKMPPQLKKVIVTHYTLLWLPKEEKAKECGISMSTYRNRLESAQWYIYARLQ